MGNLLKKQKGVGASTRPVKRLKKTRLKKASKSKPPSLSVAPATPNHDGWAPIPSKTIRNLRAFFEALLVLAVLLFLLGLLGVTPAMGSGTSLSTPFPAASVFPASGGILFPGLNVAAGVNPAALTEPGKAGAAQLAYSPALVPGDSSQYFVSGALSRKNLGFGLGYDGFSQNGALINGGFIGAGFGIDPISLGLALRQLNLNGILAPSVDIGFRIGEGSGPVGGFVLYDLNSAAQLDLGIGWAVKKKYNVELNVLVPPFADLNDGFIVTAAATVNAASIFNVYFRVSFLTLPSTTSETVGLSAALSDNFNLLIQYTTPRVWTAGFTVLI